MKKTNLISVLLAALLLTASASARAEGGYVFVGGIVAGLTGSLSDAEELVIPAEIDGQSVEMIYRLESTALKRVVLPASVHTIYRDAFAGCPNLESINLENVRLIYKGAFRGCERLNAISSVGNLLPKSCHIGDEAFARTGLTSLFLDRNLAYFAQVYDSAGWAGNARKAFSGCSSLRALRMTDAVTEIGGEAFKDCTSLDYLYFPAGINAVSGAAFSGCTSLRTAVFPAKNVEIYNTPGAEATFAGCERLTIIGKAGTSVEEYAAANGIPFIPAVISANEKSSEIGAAAQTATVTVNGVEIPAYTVNGSVYAGESALKCAGFGFKWNRETRTTTVTAPPSCEWSAALDTNPNPYWISYFSSDTVFYYNGFRIPALNVGNGESIVDVNALAGAALY